MTFCIAPLNWKNHHAMSNILGEITDFLEKGSTNTLEITFAQLEIDTYRNGHYLHSTQRPISRLVVHRLKDQNFAKIRVVDNLVFPFWFWFKRPSLAQEYHTKMLKLTRPLAEGSLQIHTDRLVLQFTIDAPKTELQLMVKHTYSELVKIA